MHRHIVPRSRPEQGRVRLPRPLRQQVLRGQRQGQREDAGRGPGQAGFPRRHVDADTAWKGRGELWLGAREGIEVMTSEGCPLVFDSAPGIYDSRYDLESRCTICISYGPFGLGSME